MFKKVMKSISISILLVLVLPMVVSAEELPEEYLEAFYEHDKVLEAKGVTVGVREYFFYDLNKDGVDEICIIGNKANKQSEIGKREMFIYRINNKDEIECVNSYALDTVVGLSLHEDMLEGLLFTSSIETAKNKTRTVYSNIYGKGYERDTYNAQQVITKYETRKDEEMLIEYTDDRGYLENDYKVEDISVETAESLLETKEIDIKKVNEESLQKKIEEKKFSRHKYQDYLHKGTKYYEVDLDDSGFTDLFILEPMANRRNSETAQGENKLTIIYFKDVEAKNLRNAHSTEDYVTDVLGKRVNEDGSDEILCGIDALDNNAYFVFSKSLEEEVIEGFTVKHLMNDRVAFYTVDEQGKNRYYLIDPAEPNSQEKVKGLSESEVSKQEFDKALEVEDIEFLPMTDEIYSEYIGLNNSLSSHWDESYLDNIGFIYVDGEPLLLDHEVINKFVEVESGEDETGIWTYDIETLFMPLRDFIEEMNGRVDWNEETSTIEFSIEVNGDKRAGTVKLDEPFFMVDGEQIEYMYEYKPFIKDGVTYMDAAQFISGLGFEVEQISNDVLEISTN